MLQKTINGGWRRQAAGAALGLCGLLAANPAHASDEALIQLLKVLKDNGTLNQKTYDEVLKAARSDVEKNAKAEAQVEQVAAQAKTPVPKFTWGPGLKVQSQDGAFSFKLGGRLQVDGGFSDEPQAGNGSTVGIRRARLQAEGKAFKWWEYKFQYDFATGSDGSTSVPTSTPVGAKAGIRDAYLALRYFDPLYIMVGNQYEPMGTEGAGSSNYTSFIEKALASDTFAPARHIGAAVGTHGEDWSAKAGIFSTSVEDAALTPTTHGDQYWDLTGRFTYAPIHTADTLVHIGTSVRWQEPNDSTAGSNDRVLNLGNKTRSEANILNTNLIGTGALDCSPGTAVNKNCVSDVVTWAAEAAGAYGPFSLQGEFYDSHYGRDSGLLRSSKSKGGTDLNFIGYYAFASWFPTGETRASSYGMETIATPATFEQVKILSPFSEGGPGAWEILARFGGVDLNSSGIRGGRQQDVTIGVNWYPDPGFRLMANWVNVVDLAAPAGKPALNGTDPNFFIMRATVYW